MGLQEEMSAKFEDFHKTVPAPITSAIDKAQADFEAKFNPQTTIQVGDKLPSFAMSDAVGKEVTSNELLKKGPMLITFYRGEWCPYCNLELRAYQQHLDKFQAKGVALVAISPELPDSALTMVEKNDLKFNVLSDVGNKLARQLGLINSLPDNLRPIFKQVDVDLEARNGDDSFEVPVPATLLVDGNGIVRNAYINPQFWVRAEPETVLGWIDAL